MRLYTVFTLRQQAAGLPPRRSRRTKRGIKRSARKGHHRRGRAGRSGVRARSRCATSRCWCSRPIRNCSWICAPVRFIRRRLRCSSRSASPRSSIKHRDRRARAGSCATAPRASSAFSSSRHCSRTRPLSVSAALRAAQAHAARLRDAAAMPHARFGFARASTEVSQDADGVTVKAEIARWHRDIRRATG